MASEQFQQSLKIPVEVFALRRHSLRVSASNVAAMAGFHPWKNLPELFLELVYQGKLGRALQARDGALLGIEFVSPHENLAELAAKAGATAERVVQEALGVKRGTTVVATVEAATALKEKALLEAAKVLKPEELRVLKEGIRNAVDTGYGTVHEDDALDAYEKRMGWPVTQRNTEKRIWDFGLTGSEKSDCTDRNGTIVPLGPPRTLRSEAVRIQEAWPGCGPIHTATSGTEVVPGTMSDDTKVDEVSLPFVSLVGSIDGLREELAPNIQSTVEGMKDDDSWIIRRVVVECKHRMRRIHTTPPIYEQIQAVLYCLMYGVDDADIVQVLRTEEHVDTGDDKHQAKRAKGSHIASVAGDESSPGQTNSNDENQNPLESTTAAPAAPAATCCTERAPIEEADRITASAVLDIKPCHEGAVVNTERCDETDLAASTSCNKEVIQPPPDETRAKKYCKGKLTLDVYRVSLDDRAMRHEENWNNYVLPRLRSFCEAVYRVRSNDDRRYNMLWATSLQSETDLTTCTDHRAWQLLFDECPWLQHCDTAFRNDRS